MIVRTYQRRARNGNRDDESCFLGRGGRDADDGKGIFWQDDAEEDEETQPCSSSSSLWNASQNDALSFSFPSSQGSSGFSPPDDDLLASLAAPISSNFEGSHSLPDFSKGKCSSTSSAGEKLKRAHTALTTPRSQKTSKITECPGPGKAGPSGSAFTAIREGMEPTTSLTNASAWGPCAPPTSTLMEAQESGEMMEHVDEANFAMDGLRPGQPPRIRRASLVSLLSICGSVQRRRLLRTHGMVKPVLDAVLAVPTDDPPTALAAAALLYVIAADGQDEDVLDSSDSIHFLMKLLAPSPPSIDKKKLSSFGNRLLRLGSNPSLHKVEGSFTEIDQGGALVVDKVNSLLSSMKGWHEGQTKGDEQSMSLPADALSSEWLALLTLEKACLSTIVLEDNTGSVRRVGGHFKERLRELGGLDVLCDLAASCYLNIRETAKRNLNANTRFQKTRTSAKGSLGVGMLLRCLKVMENVTFLSENNQKHLLDMILLKECLDSPHSFVGVVVGTINTVSEFMIKKKHGSQCTGNRDNIATLEKEKKDSMSSEDTLFGRPGRAQTSITETLESIGNPQFNTRVPGPSRQNRPISGHKIIMEEPKDPFDFDGLDEITEHSSLNASRNVKGQAAVKREYNHGSVENISGQGEVTESVDWGCFSVMSKGNLDEDTQEKILLEDCLLSAVKVLMNLTNDNDLGCRQVAVSGGLDAMASLITEHYPSFRSVSKNFDSRKEHGISKVRRTEARNANHDDEDLDLLVVILGVLVNLVEKDTRNRGRLALLNIKGSHANKNTEHEKNSYGMIRLLCSIFVSKEGAGKAAESSGGKFVAEIDPESNFKQGQQEAENMILEAYSALLLAFLSKESVSVRAAIAKHLPRGTLSTLVPVLERFLAFHLSLNMLSAETHAAVIDIVESCKDPL